MRPAALPFLLVFLAIHNSVEAEWKKHVVVPAAMSMINSAVAHDFNQDGAVDILSSYDGRVVLFQGPHWRPQTVHVFAAVNSRNKPRPNCIHSCLLDADGDGDLDFCGSNNTVFWLECPDDPFGSKSWTYRTIDDEILGTHCLITGDVNRDGRADLIANSGRPEGKTSIPDSLTWLETPSNPHSAKSWIRHVFADRDAPGGSHYTGFGDINGDGRADITCAAKGGDGFPGGEWFAWWEQPLDATSRWRKHLLSDRQPGATNIHPVDVNGDGQIDFVATRGHGKGVLWFRGPDFEPIEIDSEIEGPHCLTTVDLDGDGDIDIATCGRDTNGTAVWYENSGCGKFQQHRIGKNQGAYDIRAVDMDGDEDLDLLIAGHTSKNIVWYENPQSQKERPNVVILFTDDQGTLDANCYGSTDLVTPNIDKLAATGVRFTQAYAHTVCCPSRAALLTGRHPQRSGIRHWAQGDMHGPKGINMALGEVTLAESLKPAGYRTALFGKWHLGAHRDFGPKKQGFDEFFGMRDGFIDNYNHYFLHGAGFHDLYEGTEAVQADGKYFPELMVDRSLKFLDENRDRPFFLYVAFNIPHYPEQSLERFQSLYKDVKDPARRSYGAIVTTTDHYIGLILDKLEALDLRKKTIVIYMSDNGHSEETSNRIQVDNHKSGLPKDHFYGSSGGGSTGKWIGHKSEFLEGGIRVPAILSYPGTLPEGAVRDQIVTAMDWYPTVTELCGIDANKDAPPLDGHSLLPIIRSPKAKSKYNGILHFAWGNRWAVRDGDWKLIDGKRLVHLADEEPEKKDHAGEHPELVSRLKTMHESWAKDVAPK
jgi:arylsulfatase A-like enzyme